MSSQTGLKVSLRRNVPLAQYTTMQVGGPAHYFAEPTGEEELLEILELAREEGLSFTVLGKGSSCIFPDEGYPDLVITMLQYQKDHMVFDTTHQQVTASGGVHLYRLALACRDHGLGGAEFLSGIPGTLGGALFMNAGFSRFPNQMNEIGDLVEEVTVLGFDGRKKLLYRRDLEFSYRKSNLRECFALGAKLQLWRRSAEEIEREMKANFEYRNTKQDLRYPSSGSIFKNPAPPHPSAGKLIESTGLKGVQSGGIKVSQKHGNYFVKVGPAKSTDVVQLIEKVQKAVFDATKIYLEPEVRIVPKS